MSDKKKKKIDLTDSSTRALLGRLWREAVSPYRGQIAIAVVFMAIVAGANGLYAHLLEPMIDQVFVARDRNALWWVAGSVFATFLVKNLADFTQAALMSRVGLQTISDLQNRLFRHLVRLDVPFFHQNSPGSLVSRFTVDITMMRGALSTTITGIGKDLLKFIGLIGLTFFKDWQLALGCVVILPLTLWPIQRLGKRMRKITVGAQVELGALNTTLEQSFHGHRMVKAYQLEDYESARVATLTDRIFRLSLKGAITRAASAPMIEMYGGIAIVVVILYGGHQVINGVMSPGVFISFLAALMMAYQPLRALSTLNASLQEGLAGAERLFRVLDTHPIIVEKPGAATLAVGGGTVTFDDVTFAYGDDGHALRALTLDIPAGKTVALVGPSGAGKSTILNLIPRFYDVTGGAIRIDGQDIRDVTLASLRSAISLVSQEITLFDDTVRANIAFGKPDATDAEVEEAARHAAAHEFIAELPHGYDTVVGQRGMRLSGGQRQRIAIARAMLKNAPILLLDEATSALDTESERKVQGALEDLMAGRTTIVIAHRLSTVVHADVINVIDRGQLIESGPHDALLAKGGHYARLYELQFAAEAEAPPEAVAG